MKSVYIFGTGKGKNIVRKCMKESIPVKGYLDNNKEIQGRRIDHVKVYSVEQIKRSAEKTVIIISAMRCYQEIQEQLLELGFNEKYIIPFFAYKEVIKNSLFIQLFRIDKWAVFALEDTAGIYIRKKLGHWYGLFSELGSIKREKNSGQKLAVVGINKYSIFFSNYILRLNRKDLFWGITAAGRHAEIKKDLGIPIREFEDLLYEEPEKLKIYVIEPFKARKAVSRLIDMGFDSRTITILCESQGGTGIQDTYDIQCGYTWIIDGVPGFVVFKNKEAAVKSFRIVTLGGSTSDPTTANIKSWSELLYERLSGMGFNIEIYAGGIGSYISTQELQKFIRDAAALKPDLVLVYSGINDALGLYSERKHPFTLFYQTDLISRIIRTGKMKNAIMQNIPVKGYTMGLENTCAASEHWLNCHRMMYAICQEYGIDFYTFLQPVNEAEAVKSYSVQKRRNIDQFYGSVREMIQKRDTAAWCKDLTAVFDGKEEVYMDICHVYERGNRIIVNHMMPYILTSIKKHMGG